MNLTARISPRVAVGGGGKRWNEIGQLQFDYLRAHGLEPHHRLLDIGCGSLRGGLHFIRYLDRGNYVGIDISSEVLKAGQRFLKDAGMEQQAPMLLVNRDLTFDLLEGQTFDMILAQSVFTHMPLSDIEECFANIHKVMADGATFFATFHEGAHVRQLDARNFAYPFDVLRALGEQQRLTITEMNDYPHPRGQVMMQIVKNT